MASTYQKLYDGYSINETQNGQSATIVLFEDSGCHNTNSSVLLPALGDPISDIAEFVSADIYNANNYANTVCTSIKGEIVPKNDGNTYQKYTVEYSTDPAQDTYTEENLRISAEWLTLEQEGQENALFFSRSNASFDGFYKRIIPTADYTVTSFHDSLVDATTYNGNASFFDIVSTVLHDTSSAFNQSGTNIRPSDGTSFDWEDGFWLCEGVDVQQIVDRHGDKKWRRTESYKYRLIQVENYDLSQTYLCGWNSSYDKKTGYFDQVVPQPYKTVNQGDWPRTMPDILF